METSDSNLEYRALLLTVDRMLEHQGTDPKLVTSRDKIVLATQYVQLFEIREDMVAKSARRLADALGEPQETDLTVLAVDAASAIRSARAVA